MRAKRVGLQKNACIALGNNRDEAGVPTLISVLTSPEPLLRGHAAWALGKIATGEAFSALERASEFEMDPYVKEEIEGALKEIGDQRQASQTS